MARTQGETGGVEDKREGARPHFDSRLFSASCSCSVPFDIAWLRIQRLYQLDFALVGLLQVVAKARQEHAMLDRPLGA